MRFQMNPCLSVFCFQLMLHSHLFKSYDRLQIKALQRPPEKISVTVEAPESLCAYFLFSNHCSAMMVLASTISP